MTSPYTPHDPSAPPMNGASAPMGHPAPQYAPSPYPAPQRPRRNPLSVVALVLAFLVFGIGGLVCGFISLHQNHVRGLRGNGLSWAALIIGALHCSISVLVIMLFARIFGG